ncbi:MAG: queuosine precursor transporter [Eubacteriales bacterium]
MSNEFLLIATGLFLYVSTLLWYGFFGKHGLFCLAVFSTIIANIEVLILVKAFGFEQTLGNILFATTFLITDILSENEGKRVAQKAVHMSITASLLMVIVSQLWLLYTPAENDWASASIHTLFENTPRLIFASLIVFAVVQHFDVWVYHKIWDFTKKEHDSTRFLWLRNNLSTIASQIINTVLYNFLAFWGVYPTKTLISIMISCFLIFLATSVLDTPFVYMARKIHDYKVKNHFDYIDEQDY